MRGLTRRGLAVIAAGALLVAVGVILGVVDLTRVGVLLVGLPVIARFLVARRGTLSAERQVSPQRVLPGVPAQVALRMSNPGRATSPLLVAEEHVNYALGDRPRMLIARLSPGESRDITYRVRSHVRGRHVLGPLTVRVSDAFGLATTEATIPGTSSVTVLPRTVPLEGLPHATAGVGGSDTMQHRVGLHGEAEVGVREFRDGDDLRRIHWPSTARTGTVMVRQDEQPARRRALVLLDTRASVHSGTGGSGSLEWAVSAAASAAVHLIAHDLETYLVLPSSTELTAPLGSVDEALDVLAVVGPVEGGDGAGLVDAVLQAQEHGSATTIAVVGPLADELCDRLTRSGPGIALVVDPRVFSARTPEVSRTTRRLAAGGWHALDVYPGARIGDLWADLLRARSVAR